MRLALPIAATAFLALLASCASQDVAESKAPGTVHEAVPRLRVLYDQAGINEIRGMSESAFLRENAWLAMQIRDSWGLEERSDLELYFNEMLLSHAEDMAAIILSCFWRDVNGVPYAIEDQAQCYRDWWREAHRLEAENEFAPGSPLPNFTCPDRREFPVFPAPAARGKEAQPALLVDATALPLLLGSYEPEVARAETEIPSNVEEALGHLRILYSQPEINEIRRMSEFDFGGLHPFFGMNMRNAWGLWGDSELARYFNGLGITHADDMSSIILSCFWRDVNGVPLAIEEQVQCYRNWWREVHRLEAENEFPNGSSLPDFTCPGYGEMNWF